MIFEIHLPNSPLLYRTFVKIDKFPRKYNNSSSSIYLYLFLFLLPLFLTLNFIKLALIRN